jgi:1-deoxy-D-xylulose 5-phosphate reductoisomerase
MIQQVVIPLYSAQEVHVANKYAMVDCGLFDSTIRTDLVPIRFEHTDWAFVLARSAAEHSLCDICIRKYEWYSLQHREV